MEKEPREAKFHIQTSEAVPTGTFYLITGDTRLYGSLTDLADNLIASGIAKKMVEDGLQINLIVNEGDWEKNREFILDV